MLLLEGFQAGLSWITILRKRAAFREAFHDFRPEVIAGYGPDDVQRLMQNEKIVRNRAKIEASIANARAFLEIVEGGETFDLWAANRLVLQDAGVRQVEVAGICTACHLEDWYSHRAEAGKTGRFGAIFCLNGSK